LFRGWKQGDPTLVPEVLHGEMTAERLTQELFELVSSDSRMTQMRTELKRLKDDVTAGADGASPSERAAREVLQVAQSQTLQSLGDEE